MSDDWKPGDDALCVNGAHLAGAFHEVYPQPGRLYEVVSVIPENQLAVDWEPGFHGPELVLRGLRSRNPEGGYWHGRFRKINPLSIEERNSEIRLLNEQPVREPAS